MTITLNVPKATEGRLQQEAQRAGLPVPEYILQLIDQRLSSQDTWMQVLDSGHFASGVSLSDEQTRREAIYDNGQ